MKCPDCGSESLHKTGFMDKTVRGYSEERGVHYATMAVQRYRCKECGRNFTEKTGPYSDALQRVIQGLLADGVTYADISRTLGVNASSIRQFAKRNGLR